MSVHGHDDSDDDEQKEIPIQESKLIQHSALRNEGFLLLVLVRETKSESPSSKTESSRYISLLGDIVALAFLNRETVLFSNNSGKKKRLKLIPNNRGLLEVPHQGTSVFFRRAVLKDLTAADTVPKFRALRAYQTYRRIELSKLYSKSVEDVLRHVEEREDNNSKHFYCEHARKVASMLGDWVTAVSDRELKLAPPKEEVKLTSSVATKRNEEEAGRALTMRSLKANGFCYATWTGAPSIVRLLYISEARVGIGSGCKVNIRPCELDVHGAIAMNASVVFSANRPKLDETLSAFRNNLRMQRSVASFWKWLLCTEAEQLLTRILSALCFKSGVTRRDIQAELRLPPRGVDSEYNQEEESLTHLRNLLSGLDYDVRDSKLVLFRDL